MHPDREMWNKIENKLFLLSARSFFFLEARLPSLALRFFLGALAVPALAFANLFLFFFIIIIIFFKAYVGNCALLCAVAV